MSENTIPPQFKHRSYAGEVHRTENGDLTLRLVQVSEHAAAAGTRHASAFIYELAAEMERLSEVLEGRWEISADPKQASIMIELGIADEGVRAEALLTSVMARFDLG